ncbi:terminase small subunit [Rossellomorea aquimaris]|uniref:terminase small subunit n=1 Tax=Rossellomorea aquimaris TaxID=189382 RepID=UPI0011E90B87|nr:terminase small subunit [Rossellomorea aquimaris]TYS91908.1 terminase small subunit [Rossellomorea aquimaris]
MDERQKRFADYYIELGVIEQAAIKAGYSERYARGNAHKLVANVSIKKYIEEQMARKDAERIASQDEVLSFLTQVLRGEVTEQVPITMKDYWEMADKEPSLKDRTKAAELIGKRYALFTDKQQLEANVGVTFVDDIGDEDES